MPIKTLPIRGRHWNGRITADGKLVKVFTIVSFNVNEDGELTGSSFLGQPTKTSSREHTGWEGDIEIEMAGPEWRDFEDQVIARDKARQAPLVVNVTEVHTYRNGLTRSWTYQNLAMKFGTAVPSREAFLRAKGTWRCDTRV